MLFDEIPLKKIVVVRAGSSVRSYNPSKRNYTLKRDQKVTVWFKFHEVKDGEHIINQAEISWAGTGGYWCHTDIDNVIAVVE